MRGSSWWWFAVLSLGGGCAGLVRISEGVTLADRRVGAEVAVTAARFVASGDHAGVAIGLRAGSMVDGAGVTTTIGLSIEAQRQPGPHIGYGEDTAPVYDSPGGIAMRAGVHAGSSLGGEIAALWSRARPDRWVGVPPAQSDYLAFGLELGGELLANGPERSWSVVRAVQEWDRFLVTPPAS